MPLAVTSYENVNILSDDQALLNLAWTLDEREFLSVNLNAIISSELEAEIRDDLDYVNRYFVKDPYGEDVLGRSVATFFSRVGWSCCVTYGAGVISLLHGLARLANGHPVYVVGETYPDFPHWVEQAEGTCVSSHAASVEAHIEHLSAVGASLAFLERPSLSRDEFSDLTEVEIFCEGALRQNAVVIIDESNANYYPPHFSAANLVDDLKNLIVIRGFSKAYGLGGLRLAYCVVSNALKERVRSAIPPLLASSLSIRIGRKILELGDVALPLRMRIREKKKEMTNLIEAAQIDGVFAASEYLPYVLLKGSPESIRSQVEGNGILGKWHSVWSGVSPGVRHVYRLSVPLRDGRMNLFQQKLKAANKV